MKPELQEKLVDYLGTLEDAVKTGSDFVAEQAPLVVQEYLLLNRIYLTAVVAAIMLVSIVLAWGLWRSIRKGVLSEWEGATDILATCWGIAAVFWFAIGVPMPLFKAGIAYDCLAVWFAPRVFLLERIAELVK